MSKITLNFIEINVWGGVSVNLKTHNLKDFKSLLFFKICTSSYGRPIVRPSQHLELMGLYFA